MVYETKKVGVRTKTTVAILYMRDIVDPKIVQDVKNKLDDLHIDGAFSATQLEELMELTKALFPLMGYTGRADFTVNCMLNGRVALIVDGTPAALIAPANLFLLVKAPEDIHFTALAATFGQTLRLLGLSVSLLLPAFFVAILSYHQDQLPYYLLATLGINRLGIPFDVAVEMFIALLFLEILREAGIRLPSAVWLHGNGCRRTYPGGCGHSCWILIPRYRCHRSNYTNLWFNFIEPIIGWND
ncbi:spore germination protein [Bacillus subtilis]